MENNDTQKSVVGEDKLLRYESYYNSVLVKEQPFYYAGMSKAQADNELQYLNDNLKAFYEGDYIPLWKQNIFK